MFKKIIHTAIIAMALSVFQIEAFAFSAFPFYNTPLLSETQEEFATPESESSIYDDAERKKIIRYSTSIGIPALTYFFAIAAWGWGDRDSWKWADERWFQEDTYQGGFDKTAHVFSHYLVMRASYNIFNYTENGESSKWFYSIGLTSLIGLGIEVGDSHAGENGFCYQDLIADAVGITLGALLEAYPVADKFIGYSAEYIPTQYFRDRPGEMWLFPDDYSGWKFMLNFKLAGFEYIGIKIPDFLRFVMIDVGFYARGYSKYDNHYREMESKRYWFIGVSVNMMEIINQMFDRKPSLENSALQQPFKYYHLPIGYKYDTRID